MEPMSRRHALQLGGLGLAAAAAGAFGLGRELTSSSTTGGGGVGGGPLVEPAVLRSSGGELQLELTAARGPVRLAGRSATALTYNGCIPGPTLYLRPGDRLRLRLINRLDAPTNLHTHGLHVSPAGNGDNVFVSIGPGESFDYYHRLPADHPPGVFWYHPHLHHLVADQLFGGLCGAIVVQDHEPVAVAHDRVLMISDITLDRSGAVAPVSQMQRMAGREGDLILVNGQLRPELSARPGERERWRVVNACTSRFLRLRLDGQRLQLLGIDSGRFPSPKDVDEVSLAPGNRADLLVTAAEGSSTLRTLPVDRGRGAGMGTFAGREPEVALATLRVAGAAVAEPAPVPAQPAPADLRGSAVVARRRLTFAMGMGGGMGQGGGMGGGGMGQRGMGGSGSGGMGGGAGMRLTIDGRQFDPARVDQSVRIGTVEEWTIGNTSTMDHPFHLHVWPMQLIDDNGRAMPEPTWQDVVVVPAGGQVTVRIRFDAFPGRTVYHCHILDHEDLGMMGVIEGG